MARIKQIFFTSFLRARSFHGSSVACNFWESHRKGKYLKNSEVDPRKVIREGARLIPGELKKLKREVSDKIRCDQIIDRDHNDYELLWRFETPESVDPWVITCDNDFNEGQSTAQFVVNQNKKGVFYGTLNTEVPKDGVLKCAGYCNIMSPTNQISFKRTRPYDWSHYTHLLMKVRGDGRIYDIVCNMHRDWDVQWNDQYHFMLYTRGGPYWQLAKIPFSKFFLNAKGRIQDKQQPIQLDQILSFGITMADSNPGRFSLEIDFIGLIHDATHTSTFDYEMYEVPSYLMC